MPTTTKKKTSALTTDKIITRKNTQKTENKKENKEVDSAEETVSANPSPSPQMNVKKNLPEEKKPQIILDTFRKHGLYEVGFEGEKTFREDTPKIKLSEEPKAPESKVDWFGLGFTTQLEEYHIRVLNCAVKFESFLS